MKTLAALTLTAAVMFTAAPAQANPATEALQQLAANQLADLKVTVAKQARQAMEQAAADVRQLFNDDSKLAEHKDTATKADSTPAVE
ncbi:hypothetical protein [Arsukibacterium sp.]|uniref:hypothetical protein n=1 Tax=Arsukibacterium sp. TaxID=1977258 RepID=UPI00356A1E33